MKNRLRSTLFLLVMLSASPLAAQDTRIDQLGYQAAEGNLAAVGRVLDSGVDVNTQWGMFDQFARMKAAEWGQLEMVRFLLSRGADPRLTDSSGRTALAWARNNGHAEVVRLLQSLEAPPAAPDTSAPGAGSVAPVAPVAQVPPTVPAPRTPVPRPAPPAAAAPDAAPGVAPADGLWRGTLEGITTGGTQYVTFRVRGGQLTDSTFHVDYHCAPQYVYRERTTMGFDEPIAIGGGRFAATRTEPAVELNVAGRFPTATTAEGTFKMEDSQLCTTRLVRWRAKRTGG